jgi:hypothetical protein
MRENTHDLIVDYLFVGSAAAALREKQPFSMIVNCTSDIRFPKYCKNGIRLSVNDDPCNSNLLLKTINESMVIEQIHSSISKKEDVLVHCFAGIQRSCTVAACYLIKYRGMKPMEAIEYIKKQRPIAFMGNVNFLSTIESFYEENLTSKEQEKDADVFQQPTVKA